MTEKQLIEKIKILKHVQPSSTWVDFCRLWLEKRIDIQSQISEISSLNFSSKVSNSKFQVSALFKPLATAMAVLMLLLMSSFGLVLAAQNSLPGHILFPVKIAFEKARLALSPQKANLQIEITSQRLWELNKLVDLMNSADPVQEKKVLVDKDKEAKVIQAVQNLQQELIIVKEQLPELTKNPSAGQKMAEIAKTTTEIVKKIPINASLIGSSPNSESEKDNQELPAIQTMKMAQEILESIEAMKNMKNEEYEE